MALADENHLRETRFTAEVMEIAAGRFDAISARMREDYGDEQTPAVGAAVLADLGWAPVGVNDYAEGMVEQLCESFELDTADDSLMDALRVAIIHTLQFAAICTDVTYERSLGLT